MSHLWQPPLFERLAPAQRVLVAGAGGGFDIYAGLPLELALGAQGKEVHLANLTFSYLGGTDAPWIARHVASVDARTSGEERYFPERWRGGSLRKDCQTRLPGVSRQEALQRLRVLVELGVERVEPVPHILG